MPAETPATATTTAAPDTLSAEEAPLCVIVHDSKGGTWWPKPEASDEIDDSDDPKATALRICRDTPMRGKWCS